MLLQCRRSLCVDTMKDEMTCKRISNKILYNISQRIKVKIIPPPLPLPQIPSRIVCTCLLCMHTDQPASSERISDSMTKHLVYSTYKADLTPPKRRDMQNPKEKIALDDKNKNKKESGEISKHERRSHASKKLKRANSKSLVPDVLCSHSRKSFLSFFFRLGSIRLHTSFCRSQDVTSRRTNAAFAKLPQPQLFPSIYSPPHQGLVQDCIEQKQIR